MVAPGVGALASQPHPSPESEKGVGSPRWILTSFPHGLTYNRDGGFKVAISGNMAAFVRSLPQLQGTVTSSY